MSRGDGGERVRTHEDQAPETRASEVQGKRAPEDGQVVGSASVPLVLDWNPLRRGPESITGNGQRARDRGLRN